MAAIAVYCKTVEQFDEYLDALKITWKTRDADKATIGNLSFVAVKRMQDLNGSTYDAVVNMAYPRITVEYNNGEKKAYEKAAG